ncbi:MAG: glycosyltransferase family 4 protein [Promethearchaeota archaeon]
MNIGFFSPTINKIGGGELVTLSMIHALEAKKHKIIIYSAQKINQAHIQNFLGQKIRFDKETNIRPNIFDPYDLENLYLNLLKSYKFHFKCDLLIDTFSNVMFPWTDAVYFQGRVRTTVLPKGAKGLIFAPYKAFLNRSIKHVESKKKILMSCSKFTAKSIERLTGLSVNVLYPSISDFFKIGNSFYKKDTIVSVTRIAPDKQPETILQIAKLAPDDFSFTIIGSCRSPSELYTLTRLKEYSRKLGLNDKVKFLLNVSREKQREVLQKAKVYLHPFIQYEAFGIAVAEAMSAGCIPIVPDVGGLKEIVPRHLRYNSLEEAALLVQKAISNWSLSRTQDSLKIANKFSQDMFCRNFLKIMQL